MPHYTTKPLQVFAIQYTGDNRDEVFREGRLFNYVTLEIDEYSNEMEIWKDGFARINIQVGDYIIRDHNGDISVMSAKEFEERYDNDLHQQ